jgi:AcrR family transcriptional regulator
MKAVKQSKSKRKTGRPLSFDREEALQKAMLAFWKGGGYETTSISDLTAALGITPPSLYTAFGDKKELFLEAVRLYSRSADEMMHWIADAPSSYDAAQQYLTRAAAFFTGDTTPHGCLLVSTSVSGSEASDDVRAAVVRQRESMTTALERRIKRDIQAGVLQGEADAETLADLVITTIQGMAVLARDGVSRERLNAVARQTMAAWPLLAA